MSAHIAQKITWQGGCFSSKSNTWYSKNKNVYKVICEFLMWCVWCTFHMEIDECLKMGLVFDIGWKRSNKVVYSVSYSVYDIQHLLTLPFVSPDCETLHIVLTRHLKIFMRAQLWTAVPGVQRRMLSIFCKENEVERKEFLFQLC